MLTDSVTARDQACQDSYDTNSPQQLLRTYPVEPTRFAKRAEADCTYFRSYPFVLFPRRAFTLQLIWHDFCAAYISPGPNRRPLLASETTPRVLWILEFRWDLSRHHHSDRRVLDTGKLR